MHDERDQVFQQLLGQSGPAFVRRGQEVQRSFDAMIDICLKQREEWLTFVRLSLGTLFALARSRAVLEEFLSNSEQLATLEKLRDDLEPHLRVPPSPTSNPRLLGQALAEVRDAIERFNERWREYIAKLDLRHVNEIRERYNRFYVLEKECALGSPRLARAGFHRLDSLKPEDFLKRIPFLPVP